MARKIEKNYCNFYIGIHKFSLLASRRVVNPLNPVLSDTYIHSCSPARRRALWIHSENWKLKFNHFNSNLILFLLPFCVSAQVQLYRRGEFFIFVCANISAIKWNFNLWPFLSAGEMFTEFVFVREIFQHKFGVSAFVAFYRELNLDSIALMTFNFFRAEIFWWFSLRSLITSSRKFRHN